MPAAERCLYKIFYLKISAEFLHDRFYLIKAPQKRR
jgi:hypothetical protein